MSKLRALKETLRYVEYVDCRSQILVCKLVRPVFENLRKSLRRYNDIQALLIAYDVIPQRQVREEIVWWEKIEIRIKEYEESLLEARDYLTSDIKGKFETIVSIAGSVILAYLKGEVTEYNTYLSWKDTFAREYRECIEYLDHWTNVMEDFHTKKLKGKDN